ncbi:hypothetical protein MPSEU_000082400 [Mayamaea pseudoterrestris]|nr:hypothetical protein MPSEU_000082400 [Mayamaea pseudoterrestris]
MSNSSSYNEASFAEWTTSLDSFSPALTSEFCARSLSNLLLNPKILTLATESSSHPSGLSSLLYQPYIYAGGGLGNMDECPLQSCIAGAGVKRDSINFASACLPFGCQAYDLSADDFNATLMRVANAQKELIAARSTDGVTTLTRMQELQSDYVNLLQRITEINKFLGTGWTCGEFKVAWELCPWGYLYLITITSMLALSAIGTRRGRQIRRTRRKLQQSQVALDVKQISTSTTYGSDNQFSAVESTDDDKGTLISPKYVGEMVGLLDDVLVDPTEVQLPSYTMHTHDSDGSRSILLQSNRTNALSDKGDQYWEAFDLALHWKRLTAPTSAETASLDGLRVGSLLWILLGHSMAITSTSGAGFANPAAFLPPHGVTTTIHGQLIFSSRFAVDTFLCISGFLVVYVLQAKMPLSKHHGNACLWSRYLRSLPKALVTRAARILPIYTLSLGFYTQIAPHLGQGPFWYQWMALLRPCHDYSWTNLFFVNNFLPLDTATTETCFYHSWYLAVDMQLFLLAPLLVFALQAQHTKGLQMTMTLFILSVATTIYLTHIRRWSSNTFDGAAVARFDVEAYAKPHIRAQSYLCGMLVAMYLPKKALSRRSPWTWMHRLAMALILMTLAVVAYLPATGAYARRPCQYKEWPELDECGSLWSSHATFLYTATSRTVWSICIATLMHLSLGRTHSVANILSWRCWTPLSRLTFATYLIHPIVLFVWQLGETSKQFFRLETFAMTYLSVSVISYVLALLAYLLVELPCAALQRNVTSARLHGV